MPMVILLLYWTCAIIGIIVTIRFSNKPWYRIFAVVVYVSLASARLSKFVIPSIAPS